MTNIDDLDKKIANMREKIGGLNESSEKNEFLEKINNIAIRLDKLKFQNESPTQIVTKQPFYKSTEMTLAVLGAGLALTAATGGVGGLAVGAAGATLTTLGNILGWVLNLGGLLISGIQVADFAYGVTQDVFNKKKSNNILEISEQIETLSRQVNLRDKMEKEGQKPVVSISIVESKVLEENKENKEELDMEHNLSKKPSL